MHIKNEYDYDNEMGVDRLVPQTGHTPSDIRALITQVVRNQEFFKVTVDS